MLASASMDHAFRTYNAHSKRPKKTAKERREQHQRAYGLMIGAMANALEALTTHRGAQPTKMGKLLRKAALSEHNTYERMRVQGEFKARATGECNASSERSQCECIGEPA